MAVNLERLPIHIAVIMDGNGRWAKKRFLNRKAGHNAGASNLKTLSEKMDGLGFKYLTVYAFSTENWKRNEEEIYDLMNILRDYFKRYLEDAKKNNLRFRHIGDLTGLDDDLQKKITDLTELTKNKSGLCVTIAINYGGRDEIVRMTKRLIGTGLKPDDINEAVVSQNLDTEGIPDPDLLIRSSGEYRLSNFLLWQLAYAELFFIDKLWPDIKIDDVLQIVEQFQNIDRRFGGRK